jgi:hypothetical protein
MSNVVNALVAGLLFGAGSVAAQEVDTIVLDATYLGAPTDWCPADAGVPLIVKMGGPKIIKGPKDFPRLVKERRGGSLRVVDGSNIASFNRAKDVSGPNAEVIGRFSAEFRTCLSAWDNPRATGTWRLMSIEGQEVASGTFEDEFVTSMHFPLFSLVAGTSDARFAKFGDRVLFTAGKPKVTINQVFLTDPDKE